MKANRIRRVRWYIRFTRWKRSLLANGERLNGMHEAGMLLFDNAVKDTDKSRLDFCPVTNKRFVTRGDDVIIIYNTSLAFAGPGYYYSLLYPQGAYCDVTERFDDELSKRLNAKHRRVLGDVKVQINGILAAAESENK